MATFFELQCIIMPKLSVIVSHYKILTVGTFCLVWAGLGDRALIGLLCKLLGWTSVVRRLTR